MCAAPGGKTTAVAILMKDKGEVVAVDRSHNKVLDIQKLAAEMGLNCITTYKLDALKAVRQRSESNYLHTASFVAQEGSDNDSTGNANWTASFGDRGCWGWDFELWHGWFLQFWEMGDLQWRNLVMAVSLNCFVAYNWIWSGYSY